MIELIAWFRDFSWLDFFIVSSIPWLHPILCFHFWSELGWNHVIHVPLPYLRIRPHRALRRKQPVKLSLGLALRVLASGWEWLPGLKGVPVLPRRAMKAPQSQPTAPGFPRWVWGTWCASSTSSGAVTITAGCVGKLSTGGGRDIKWLWRWAPMGRGQCGHNFHIIKYIVWEITMFYLLLPIMK